MVRLKTCDCGPAFLIRTNRSWWMRWIPSRRLYYCARCDSEMFLTREALGNFATQTTRAPLSVLPSIVLNRRLSSEREGLSG
jgi:hypothetical protein